MTRIDFTINNDEIEKVSKRIHELQTLKEKDIPLSDEQKEEYVSLFRLKDLLYRANQIDDKEAFIVIDGMRIERKKVDEFKNLLKLVNVIGLASIPNYLGDILPGTKYKMPRSKNKEESFLEYEEYLYNYYLKLGYNFENVTYYPATKVPKLRKPYPHEMYYGTENGYVYDQNYLGTHNKYYQEYKRFLEEELAKEYETVIKYAIKNYEILPPIGQDIDKKHQVVDREPFTLFINMNRGKSVKKDNSTKEVFKIKESPLMKALSETAKALIKKQEEQFKDKPLEELTPTLKTDITIPENLKQALKNISDSKQKVVETEESINKLIGRARDILPRFFEEKIKKDSYVVTIDNGFYLFNIVPKDILIGNALSKRTVRDKRKAYEIASKYRRLMSSDNSLSHYHDMLLQNFLKTNEEVTTIIEEPITEETMRIA